MAIIRRQNSPVIQSVINAANPPVDHNAGVEPQPPVPEPLAVSLEPVKPDMPATEELKTPPTQTPTREMQTGAVIWIAGVAIRRDGDTLKLERAPSRPQGSELVRGTFLSIVAPGGPAATVVVIPDVPDETQRDELVEAPPPTEHVETAIDGWLDVNDKKE